LGLGCCISYRPVWSSENEAEEEKRKISRPLVPPNFAKFLGLAVAANITRGIQCCAFLKNVGVKDRH
jgi:hypothetical protein